MHPKFIPIEIQGHHGQWYAEDLAGDIWAPGVLGRMAIYEACTGILEIQDICNFTSRDTGYFPFYFQGYGILCSIFGLLSGILNILEK